MTVIKLLLLAAILVVGLLAFRGSQKPIHKVIWRAYVVLVLVAAALAIVFPNALTRLANEVGSVAVPTSCSTPWSSPSCW